MREMKDSGIEWIGEIPKEWEVLRNKNVFNCTKELVGEKSIETQLLSLTTKGVRKKDINNAEGKLPESFDTYQYVKINDIIMCLFDLDCSAVFSGISSYDGMISPAYRVLTCTDRTFPKYAGYWFNYISYDRKFNHYAKNIRYTISYEEFSTLPVIVPPYEEQQAISSYLDAKCTKIDSIIEKQEKVIEKLKEYKLSVITEAVTKGLNPDVKMKDSGVDWIGEIPESWEYAKLNNICTFHNGDRSLNYPTPADFVDEGIPFIGADSLNNHFVDVRICKYITNLKYNAMSGLKIEKNDILYTLRGSTIGKNALCNFNNGTVASSLMGIRISLKNKCFSTFLSYWLNSDNEYIQRDICINGSTAPNLSAENVKSFIIFLPPIEEQQQIADYLDKKCSAIDSAIEKKQAIIEKLKEYKKSLIYEVVTGKKEV